METLTFIYVVSVLILFAVAFYKIYDLQSEVRTTYTRYDKHYDLDQELFELKLKVIKLDCNLDKIKESTKYGLRHYELRVGDVFILQNIHTKEVNEVRIIQIQENSVRVKLDNKEDLIWMIKEDLFHGNYIVIDKSSIVI